MMTTRFSAVTEPVERISAPKIIEKISARDRLLNRLIEQTKRPRCPAARLVGNDQPLDAEGLSRKHRAARMAQRLGHHHAASNEELPHTFTQPRQTSMTGPPPPLPRERGLVLRNPRVTRAGDQFDYIDAFSRRAMRS